jgi:hypothetical protein
MNEEVEEAFDVIYSYISNNPDYTDGQKEYLLSAVTEAEDIIRHRG